MIAKAPHSHEGIHTHLPDLEDFLRFLCAEPNNTTQIWLPLWEDDEILDLQKVAYPGMSEHQVRSWQLLPLVAQQLAQPVVAMFQASLFMSMSLAGPRSAGQMQDLLLHARHSKSHL